MPLVRTATRVRWTAAATATIGVLLVLGTIGQALSDVHVRSDGPLTFRVFGLELTGPTANVPGLVLLVLAGVGAGIVIAGLRSAWRLESSRRALLRSLPVAGALPGRAATLIVEDDRPLAFCTGYPNPRIYISRGALARSSNEELCAVLAHEEEHRRRRDPLRIACARVLCDALFFLPVLHALSDRSATLAELLADDAAVEACAGDPAPLAAAMLMFGADPQESVVGIAPERVDRLMGQPCSWRAPVLLAATSLVGIVSLALLTWQMGRQALLQTTLNLPVLSSQPCVVVLAALPLAAIAVGLSLRRATG